MLIFGYLLLLLIPIGAVALIVWNHKRKTAARDLASAGTDARAPGVANMLDPRRRFLRCKRTPRMAQPHRPSLR